MLAQDPLPVSRDNCEPQLPQGGKQPVGQVFLIQDGAIDAPPDEVKNPIGPHRASKARSHTGHGHGVHEADDGARHDQQKPQRHKHKRTHCGTECIDSIAHFRVECVSRKHALQYRLGKSVLVAQDGARPPEPGSRSVALQAEGDFSGPPWTVPVTNPFSTNSRRVAPLAARGERCSIAWSRRATQSASGSNSFEVVIWRSRWRTSHAEFIEILFAT